MKNLYLETMSLIMFLMLCLWATIVVTIPIPIALLGTYIACPFIRGIKKKDTFEYQSKVITAIMQWAFGWMERFQPQSIEFQKAHDDIVEFRPPKLDVHNPVCPDCGGNFLRGPEAVCCVNIKCSVCGAKFNLNQFDYSLDRIQ